MCSWNCAVALALGTDLRCDLVDQRHKLFGLGHEVSFTSHLNNGSGVSVAYDRNGPFARFTIGALGGRCEALDPQPLRGGLHVPVVGFERLLRVHHANARCLAKCLYVFGGDTHLVLLFESLLAN